MTGKQEQEEDITLEEVIEEVEDQLAKDEVSAETDTEAATLEITIESLSEQIEALKTTAVDNLDKAVRAQAELDNVRKRTTRDVENAHKYALDKFINELLPVLDSMELGIIASVEGEDVNSLREGLELTLKMFCSCLEKSGVHPVNPQKGDKFNPKPYISVQCKFYNLPET